MKRLPAHEWTDPAEFEHLEARLLLDAAGFIQPDGPMPQTAPTGTTPAEQVPVAADRDGDGKLSLNDAKASAAGEPTSLTFNGRGIDLNEDGMVDSLGAAPTADLTSRPIIEDILGCTEDFEDEGPADMPFIPQERPILEVVLGSTGDYEYTGDGPQPVAPQADGCMCHRNLVAQAMGLDADGRLQPPAADAGGALSMMIGIHNGATEAGAGHCKIMAVRVANPEG